MSQRLLGLTLTPFQIRGELIAALRILQSAELGVQSKREMLRCRTDLGHRLLSRAGLVVRDGITEECHQCGEVGLRIEFLIVELQCMRTQRRRHRDGGHGDLGLVQMRGVGGHHLTPVRVQIRLGVDNGRDGAQVECLLDENQFGFGEFGTEIADHEHDIGIRQQPEGARQVRLTESADTGRIHQAQATFEHRAGNLDFHPQHLSALCLRCTLEVFADIGHRNRDDLRFSGQPPTVILFGGGNHQGGRRLLAVADNGCHRGGFVIAHPRDRHVE